MIQTNAGWRLLAISLSVLLHIMLVTEWSDKMTSFAAFEQEKLPPMLVQLTFQRPPPEPAPEVIPPPKPIVKKVVKPEPKPKPKPKPKIKKSKTKPIPKPVVAETQTITPPEEKQDTMQSPSPSIQLRANLREQYLAKLLAKIEENKYYPTIARRRNIEGKIEVSFKLACNGKVTQLRITGQHSLLRKAASKSIDAAQPLPEIPSQIECPMPVNYVMAYSLDN